MRSTRGRTLFARRLRVFVLLGCVTRGCAFFTRIVAVLAGLFFAL
jgi:hypothetical protein